MPLGVRVMYEIGWVPAGVGAVFLNQQQASNPGQGQSQYPYIGFVAQLNIQRDFEPIPVAAGSEGSVTLANIKTALDAASTAVAGAGTPLITPAQLAIIQGWATGGT
jgi:hypothetical protein